MIDISKRKRQVMIDRSERERQVMFDKSERDCTYRRLCRMSFPSLTHWGV
jgi:hypothetical protein